MDYENQQMLERIFNAHQTVPLLRAQFLKAGVKEPFRQDLLAQMVLHRQANLPTLVGLLRHYFQDDLQLTADAILLCAQADDVDFDPTRNVFILRYDVDQKTHDLINQYRYLPPMIVPPQKLKHNMSSGYLTIERDSLILRDNHHDGDIGLQSLNTFNAIPLSINQEVVKGIGNTWKGIDKQKPDETLMDYQARVKAFEKYEQDSYWMLAMMIEMGNEFYLTHKVDKRGRTYAQGYHINTQGNSWNKACVEFHNQEVINWD